MRRSTSIRAGKFLKALVREEIRQDKDWVIRLRALPESPETYYLMDLMASHDFQSALQNYLDLEDLRKKLAAWQGSFDAFDDLIGLRRAYYEPLLPDSISSSGSSIRECACGWSSTSCSTSACRTCWLRRGPDFLATAEERVVGERLDALAGELQRRRQRPGGSCCCAACDRLQGRADVDARDASITSG